MQPVPDYLTVDTDRMAYAEAACYCTCPAGMDPHSPLRCALCRLLANKTVVLTWLRLRHQRYDVRLGEPPDRNEPYTGDDGFKSGVPA
jgi:hypothetical protein